MLLAANKYQNFKGLSRTYIDISLFSAGKDRGGLTGKLGWS